MDETFNVSPNSIWTAKLIAGRFNQSTPKGHFVECPSQSTLAICVDALRYYQLIDNNQESSAVRVLQSAAKARLAGKRTDFLQELEALATTREGADGHILDDVISKVGAMLSNTTLDPSPVDFEDDESPYHVVEKKVFAKPADVIAATSEEAAHMGNGKARYMPKLQGLGSKKRVVKVPDTALDKLSFLKGQMPNFAEVIDDVIVQVKAQQRLNRGIKLQSMLLLGKPGIGKTRFIKKLAACFDAESHVFNMGGNADTVKLRGVAKGWGSARPGEIASKLAKGDTFNPFFLFDEIEKAHRSGHDALHDVHGLLLSYLEPETNTAIEDDYCGFAMDLSGISYVFAANSIDVLPAAFMSRIDVYNIPDLSPDDFLNLGRMMLVEISETEFDGALKSAPLDVLKELVKCNNARELRRAITRAIARAVGEGEERLTLDHVRERSAQDDKPTMGFY